MLLCLLLLLIYNESGSLTTPRKIVAPDLLSIILYKNGLSTIIRLRGKDTATALAPNKKTGKTKSIRYSNIFKS